MGHVVDYDDDETDEEIYYMDKSSLGHTHSDEVSKLSPTDSDGIQGLLLQDSLALVDKRIRDFRQMDDLASDLENWVSERFLFQLLVSRLGRKVIGLMCERTVHGLPCYCHHGFPCG
jgi:hypothetical protein